MKRKNLFLLLTLATVLALSLLIIGCEPEADDVDLEEDKVLKLGVLGPYSGHNARIGQEFRGSVEMAFEEIDYQIEDYRVELVWIDSESDPESASRAYEEAVVRDEIDAGILNWHSSVAVACMDVSARNQVPHFFTLGATDVVNEKYEGDPEYYSYWLKGWPKPETLSIGYIEALLEAQEEGLWEPRNNRLGIYGEDTDWGRSYGESFAADFEAQGWEVVAEVYFTAGETDLVPLLSSLRDADPSVIAGSIGSPPSWGALITQAQEIGIQSVIIADGLGWVGEWYDLTGEDSNYVLDQIPTYSTEEAMAWRDAYEEKYGISPSPSGAGIPYDYTKFFIEIAKGVLEEHGELNRETIHQYSQDYIWTGEVSYTDGMIMDKYVYSPTSVPDPVVGEEEFIFPVLQYMDGEGRIIWPTGWKEIDFETPAYIND